MGKNWLTSTRTTAGVLRLRRLLLLLLQAKLPFRLTKAAGKAWRTRPQAGGASMLKLPLPLPMARSTALAGGASMLRPLLRPLLRLPSVAAKAMASVGVVALAATATEGTGPRRA